MGLIQYVMNILFGGGGNVLKETAEVFLPNAEASDRRRAEIQTAALNQMAAEFTFVDKSWFDKFMDGVNRVPRPALALGTLGLIMMAMIDPVWFAARMQGLALVPEPLWWLLGIIVSFYFGARQQTKAFQFQKAIAATFARAPEVAANIALLEGTRDARGAPGAPRGDSGNPALDDWRHGRDG